MVTIITAQGGEKGRKGNGWEGRRRWKGGKVKKESRKERNIKKMTPLSFTNLTSEMGLKLNNGLSLLTIK